MSKLIDSLKNWKNSSFPEVLKAEITGLGVEHLPLQEAASPGALVMDSDFDVMVLTSSENESSIKVKIAVMFSEVLGGYCCGDDEPIVSNAYCELDVMINKITADTEFALLSS